MHGLLSRIPCFFGMHGWINTKIQIQSGGLWIEYYECRRCEKIANPESFEQAVGEVLGLDNKERSGE